MRKTSFSFLTLAALMLTAATDPCSPEVKTGTSDTAAGDTASASPCDTAVAADADGDGYLDCQECDDANASVNPDATESCNGADDNCDGVVDDTRGAISCYTISAGECHTVYICEADEVSNGFSTGLYDPCPEDHFETMAECQAVLDAAETVTLPAG